jgi:ribosome maturation factor RimP
VLVGVLTGVASDRLTVQVDNRVYEVDAGNVEKARLVPAI